MRLALAPVLAVVLTAVAGMLLCKILGWNPGVRGMVLAAIAATVAGAAGCVPLVLSRGADQGGMAQAALVGSLAHMLFLLMAVAVVLLGGPAVGNSFTFWILAFYGATLSVLVAIFMQAIKSAPIRASQRQN